MALGLDGRPPRPKPATCRACHSQRHADKATRSIVIIIVIVFIVIVFFFIIDSRRLKLLALRDN